MAQKTIVYWKDIPAQVIVGKGRKKAKRELDNRFIVAIDACAMKLGLHESDAYLEQWRRGEPENVSDDLEAEADKAQSELEATYTRERVKEIVAAGGVDDNR